MPDALADLASGPYGRYDSAALAVRLRLLADDDRYCIDDWSQGICRQAADNIELLHEANSDVRRIALERDGMRRVLEEVNEVLSEMNWHTDRGVLQRVRDVLRIP